MVSADQRRRAAHWLRPPRGSAGSAMRCACSPRATSAASACPTYPEIRLSLFPGRGVARAVERLRPAVPAHCDRGAAGDRGPALLHAARACASRPPITRNFPNICGRDSRSRSPPPIGRCAGSTAPACAAWSRPRRCDRISSRADSRISRPGGAASTPTCSSRGPKDFLDLPRPVAAYVGRVAVEKNIEAFLQDALARQQDRHRRRPRACAARGAISGREVRRLSLCRGPRAPSGGRGRHGVPEPHRHLRPGESRGHGLRGAGGRLSRHRPDRRDHGRRHRGAR